MKKKQLEEIKRIFDDNPDVKLAYFFGSQAKGEAGPASDYDFAVYFDNQNSEEIFSNKAKLLDQLSRQLQTDKIDIVILDTAKKPELKYNIISEGQLIFEKDPYKVILEPKILNEYFDFQLMLKKHGLTKS
ncbi:nucleotidyltransferase domain-containing protein [Patescibacteria group bacterium]|nr:nucleotidyltransferase domain-containing protein [Patescibacteria group bacterium]